MGPNGERQTVLVSYTTRVNGARYESQLAGLQTRLSSDVNWLNEYSKCTDCA